MVLRHALRRRKSILKGTLVLPALAVAVASCTVPGGNEVDRPAAVPVTQAPLPTKVQTYTRIEDTLACIRRTEVLKGKTFVVGSFADSTGKINAVASGATGNFLPQGGSAAYVTDSLSKAGATVVSTYFGVPTEAVPTDYAINGIYNSLDFSLPVKADIRVGGVGPTVGIGWAQLSLSIQLDESSTRVNRQMSMIQRPVRYTQLGAGVGRTFGNTLASGNVAFQNQERLQLEALNGPIALGVADVVMKEFPHASNNCRRIVGDLLDAGT